MDIIIKLYFYCFLVFVKCGFEFFRDDMIDIIIFMMVNNNHQDAL